MDEKMPPVRRRARRADAPRDKRVNLRLNSLEYAVLLTAAAKKHQQVGAYVAASALAVAREEVSPAPVETKDRLRTLAEARVSVNRIGNNLNQIAHVLNGGGEETPERLAAVLAVVERAVASLDAATIATMQGER
ncbi:plasmid mobilization relaxosome protein MobC [Streptomyces sp. NRRL WC-3742]|uniref:plasmid mobilization relaxosome protein MobC n=1 Tax=Streptomyces sp. NRRL WC-3742 TaxID=1463934 RepID=UPI00099CCA77|nr:plasmid mobilization relaxosome protein MobC [Streptomyces sp. NRRL WC-3742]